MIKYLQNKDINYQKWDECIQYSVNTRIYAYTWWLDSVCEHWDGLVYGDYEAVMPLPWKQKYLLKYIYQPPFTQQLGIFSTNSSHFQKVQAYISAIPKVFVSIDTTFNDANIIENNKYATTRRNQVLKLATYYDEICHKYDKRLKEILKKYSNNYEFDIIYHLSIIDNVKFINKFYTSINLYLKNDDYARLTTLMTTLEAKNIYHNISYMKNNEIIGSQTYFVHNHRIYLSVGGCMNEYKQYHIMHCMYDMIIKQFHDKSLLDFEGSEIEGVHFFNSRFGALDTYYTHYRRGIW
ncbi:MAG: hypothetical protein NW207_06550 [Cytophagales bacterium]|nr:hypothetical protein [Cytophagales bacterium]